MRVNIELLGDFGIWVDTHPVVLPAQKSRALLAWLACHWNQPQPRDRLVGVLWGDRPTANAKASLRQAIAGLRRLLPADAITTQGDYVELNRSLVSSDVAEFRALKGAADLAELQRLSELYRGDLMDGFNARAAAFEEWLTLEREMLRNDALAGLRHLLELELANGSAESAIAVGGRLLTLDPLQENVHRTLMQVYADQGQLGSARRQFKLCREVLDRELGMPPAQETVALLNSLSDTPAAGASNVQVPASIPMDAAAVDRRAALPSIAVLPFRNQSSNEEHQYLADGMTEELINLLTNSANWQVCARNLSFHYRDRQPDIREVGRDLGVGYVVDGSIRSMGDRVRVSASLVGTQDGIQLWSDRYDRPVAEIFDVQDEVVHGIFRTLKNRLGFAERERVRRTPKTNLDAWGLLIKAMQVHVVDAKSHLEQLSLVTEALELEPEYPRAHAYLSELLFTAVGRGTSTNAKLDAATAAHHVEAALSSGSADTVVLKMCAGGLAAVGQAAHALSLAERANELSGVPDPLLVAALMWNGRLAEAKEYCEAIVAQLPANVPLPPGELRPVALLGNLHMLRNELQPALEFALRDQRSNPGNFFAHVNLANVYGLLGDRQQAVAAWQLAKAIVPQLSVAQFSKGYRSVFVDKTLAARFSEGLVQAGFDSAPAPSG